MALWGNKDLKQANTASDGATVTGTTTCTFAANTAATHLLKKMMSHSKNVALLLCYPNSQSEIDFCSYPLAACSQPS